MYPGGYGAYTAGDIQLNAGQRLYINVGGKLKIYLDKTEVTTVVEMYHLVPMTLVELVVEHLT